MSKASFQFHQLPDELQLQVLLHLDAETLFKSAVTVCKQWSYIINDDLFWKEICYRDFYAYTQTKPIDSSLPTQYEEEEDRIHHASASEWLDEVQRSYDPAFEQDAERLENYNNLLRTSRKEDEVYNKYIKQFKRLEQLCLEGNNENIRGFFEEEQELFIFHESESTEDSNLNSVDTNESSQTDPDKIDQPDSIEPLKHKDGIKNSDWADLYKTCYKRKKAGTIDVSGYFVANYGEFHGDEIVHIQHYGFRIEGIKVTGDANVPSGKPTFRANLLKNQVNGRGGQHLAETGYQNPRWGRATLSIIDYNKVNVSWHFLFPEFGVRRQWYTSSLHFNRLDEAASEQLNQTPLIQ